MQPLTKAQERVLRYIQRFVAEKGYPPTVREIASAFGFRSPMAAKAHLDALARKGYIRKIAAVARGIELCNFSLGAQTMSIPIVGKIRAGSPIYAVEDIQQYLTIDANLIKLSEGFALTVEGESMIAAGIYPGDIVIVRAQNTAEPGDIVVALIEDEATIKRFFIENNMVVLKPENPEMKPLKYKPEQVKIIGKVVGLFRRF